MPTTMPSGASIGEWVLAIAAAAIIQEIAKGFWRSFRRRVLAPAARNSLPVVTGWFRTHLMLIAMMTVSVIAAQLVFLAFNYTPGTPMHFFLLFTAIMLFVSTLRGGRAWKGHREEIADSLFVGGLFCISYIMVQYVKIRYHLHF